MDFWFVTYSYGGPSIVAPTTWGEIKGMFK
jgi:hypothetical protein